MKWKKEVPLTKRLAVIASMCRQGVCVADIGTDHAYLVCSLVQQGIAEQAIASDINRLPLARAEENIRDYGLENQIQTILSDGFANLPIEEIDDVVIAGMGGETIAAILEACPAIRVPSKRFILQPMTKLCEMREYLYARGFTLLREQAVCEGEHIYTVMLAQYTGQPQAIDPLTREIGLVRFNNGKDDIAYMVRSAQRLFLKARGLEQAAEESVRVQAESCRSLAAEIAMLAGDEYEQSARSIPLDE